MTRRSISTVLGSLLVGLLIALNAPAVSADAPCILDNAGNCAAAPGRDFTSQQIAEFDALSVTALGVTTADVSLVVSADAPCITDGQGNCASTQVLAAQGMSTNEYDAVLTALEMASTANTVPFSAYLTDSVG
jgi:hypothetical protein